ncbi:HAD hydrolase family protein [Candidatus Microthrix parvicella]|uniref:HAD hydrolase family protein n=1 Tax=Candidatus Neomicrothrix parvicella TaxID=41950 RepID=UPI00037B712B|nr:HAD hydrolase family protein [Candidatus Microthrix parvicella]
MLPLICIDVDGTLIGSSGVPSDGVWAAAEAAVARGQHLAICTARVAVGPTWDYAQRLDPTGVHIFHSGATLIHADTREVNGEEVSEPTIAACEALAAMRGWVLEYYSAFEIACPSTDPLAEAHAGLLGIPHVPRGRDALTGPVVRLQFVVPIGDTDTVLAAVPESAQGTAATSPAMAEAAFVSVTKAGVSKASAITKLACSMGIGTGSVMMVGDGHNDVSAMEVVGWGVAMGNADPSALAASRIKVGHVDDDGLAEALALSTTLD